MPRRVSRRVLIAGLAVCLVIGVAIGVASFTFVYAKGASYLTNDPAACANCHVMQQHYDAWQKSSHKAVAGCNDCHTPSSSFVNKYYTKALNGWNHSRAFTVGWKEPLRITGRNREVTEAQCRACHGDVAAAIDTGDEPISCIRCHDSVGHRTGD